MRYVALLRGINVNGRTIRMTELRSAIEELDVADVTTILATGNVLFTSTGARAAVKKAVEKKLTGSFGYTAHIVLLTAAELKKIIADCPFTGTAETHSYIIVSSDPTALREVFGAAGDLDPSVETVQCGAKALYWKVRKGSSTDTPFAKLTAKQRYVSVLTNRNRNTMEKVLAAV